MNLKPAFSSNNVPVAVSCSNRYVPYISVLLQSIIENSTQKYNYDIVILNKDYSEHNKQILEAQCKLPNFSIRFVDVNEYISGKNFYTKNLSVEAYFRMFLIDIMKEYDKILYLDVDIVTLCDIGELFDTDIGDNYIAASIDINIVGSYISGNHWKPYIDEVLCLKDPNKYVQSGVMIMNLKAMRKSFSLKYISEICTAKEWRLFDQDILNSICQDKIYLMDMHYNVINGMEGRMENIKKWTPDYLKEQWFEARKAPKIVHYVGKKKPWISFDAEYSEYFWDYAKRSSFYHNLIVGRVATVEIVGMDKKLSEVNRKLAELQHQVSQATITPKQATANTPNTANTAKPAQAAAPAKSIAVAKTSAPVPNSVKTLSLPDKKTADAVLIRCQSVYQLFNAINLVLTVLADKTVDIMLTASTDFSQYVEPLKKSNLFRNVFLSDDNPETYIAWRGLDAGKRRDVYTHPEKYIIKPFDGFEPAYSDYFIAVSDEYNKIFYYYMVQQGYRPDIHFFEDGMNSYILDNKAGCDSDFIEHEIYGAVGFPQKIKDQYSYEPTIVINKVKGIDYLRLPRLANLSKKTKRIYNSIFPHEQLPKEKYIFLEEAFYCDGIASTDVELVEALADMVGKDNIIVKLHPRNDYDRFTPRGFKVMQAAKAPWEMTLMNVALSEKVFVSVSSTAALTSGLVFDKRFTAIELFKVMSLGKNIHVRNANFLDFYNLLKTFLNNREKQLFTPSCIEEFEEEIFYIEGGIE